MRFAHPFALALLAILPLLAILYRRADARRRSAAAAWGVATWTAPRLLPRLLLALAFVVLTFAIARPETANTPTPTQTKTPDLVFLLDVSRSMLADDVQPTRLSRAKTIIVSIVHQARSARVALVAFAGNTAIQCPLTIDHAFFEEMLAATGPDSVTRGGTRLADAIRFASAQVFNDPGRESKRLILVSDGEDHAGSVAEAAHQAASSGIGIAAIGIGDELAGALVPRSEEDRAPFLFQGQPVRSRMDTQTLHSAGNSVDARSFDAAAFYRDFLAPRGVPLSAATDSPSPLWPCLLAAALALLLAETWISQRKTAIALLLILALTWPRTAPAQTVEEWMTKGRDALWSQANQDAVHFFSQALQWQPNRAEARFNLGLALYRDGQYQVAAEAFAHAARSATEARLQAKSKFGQGNALYRYARESRTPMVKSTLRAAVSAWHEALALDPTSSDARYNIDLVEAMLREPPPDWPGDSVPRPGADPLRAQETDPDRIAREGRAPKPSAATREPVEKDW